MHDIDILKGYRSMSAEVMLLRQQLDRISTAGAPRGYGQHAWDRAGSGTTNPEAARQQHIDYLTELLEQKNAELAEISMRFEGILAAVTDTRLQVILRSYYAIGLTDEAIAEALLMSTRRVNALRNGFLRSLELPDAA